MAVYKQQLFTESVSACTATPSVELGTRRIVNGNEYVYCYNAETVADQNLFVRANGANDTGYSFTVTTVSGTNLSGPIIGVVSNQTIAAATYGWVQTKGKAKYMAGGAVTMSVGGAIECARLIVGADGAADFATGGTGSTGTTIGYLTTAVSDVTGTSVNCYVSTGF